MLGVAAALGLTIFSGVLQGRMRNRWGVSPDAVQAAGKLARIPLHFGDWNLIAKEQLGETEKRMLECAACFVGNYRNRVSDEVVKVTVLLGPPGSIAAHTPEVCFSSTGLSALGEREGFAIRGENHHEDRLWALTYKVNDVNGGLLRACYAWSSGGRWAASEYPRFEYAGKPYLYKIQTVSRLPLGTDLQAHDPCKRFLRDFLPVVRDCMVEPPEGK